MCSSSTGLPGLLGFLRLVRASRSTGQQLDREERQNPATGKVDGWLEAKGPGSSLFPHPTPNLTSLTEDA